jgi:sec-independent protein translocase protein TatC
MRPHKRRVNKRDACNARDCAAHPMSTQDTFISHLVELRDRLLRAILAVLLVFLCLFPWAKDMYTLLALPLLAVLPQGGQMIATDVVGVFLVPMKVALLVAFVIALPYVLYQIWAFVAPGLYTHEKRLVLPLIVTSTLLFIAGMAFAYFLVFPVVFKFMASIAPEGVAWMTDIEKYLSFALTMFVAFGVTFEVPVAVVLLVRMNVVSVDKLREIRPYVIVGAFVIGAVFTPPDVISQLMLAVPLWVLYELGILVASMMSKSAPADASPEKKDGVSGSD